MRLPDRLRFAARALDRYRLRSALMLTAMAIGVAAVVLLTALGEGARRYVAGEFAALGSNLLVVLPGRSETRGGPPPMLGETPRDLTLDDALALTRSHLVRRMAPLSLGSTTVAYGGRSRETTILGSTAEFAAVRHLTLAQGRFLPPLDPARAAPVCVLGAKVKAELFGREPALGRWVRLGDRRFRVLGVLEAMGQSLGTDVDETVVVPVASAQALFDRSSLFRILVEVRSRDELERAGELIRAILRERHEGEEDITLLTQDALLATFDQILRTLTLVLAGIAAISLVVAGILIMNVTLVAVTQRTAEIGLLKALGAPPALIRRLFLTEAALQALAGAAAGVTLAALALVLGRRLFPAFPLVPPAWAVPAAVAVALACALLFAWLPARRAARLDPVLALGR